jgi:hypothetical protein
MNRPHPLTIATAAGSLEAIAEDGGDAEGPALLLCHPHPQYGGSMDDTVLDIVAQALRSRVCGILRFNFRGVGASTGQYDGGRGEVADVEAAAHEAARRWPGRSLWLCGYSFGSAMVWQALRSVTPARVLLIAPPVGAMAFGQWPALAVRVDAIYGDDDSFIDADALTAWSRNAAPDVHLHVVPGADHFFAGEARTLATLLTTLP